MYNPEQLMAPQSKRTSYHMASHSWSPATNLDAGHLSPFATAAGQWVSGRPWKKDGHPKYPPWYMSRQPGGQLGAPGFGL